MPDRAFPTFASDSCQLGVFEDFHPPALVVREMPVQNVYFVLREHVHEFFQIAGCLEMPDTVQHYAPPAKLRPILNEHMREFPLSLRHGACRKNRGGKHLQKGLASVKRASRMGGGNFHPIPTDPQGECLRAVILGNLPKSDGRSVLAGMKGFNLPMMPRTLCQPCGKQSGGGQKRLVRTKTLQRGKVNFSRKKRNFPRFWQQSVDELMF